MRKALIAVWMVLVMGTVLAGCSSKVEFEPEESSIFIQRDGSVTGYTKEEGYDKSYYSLEELTNDYVVPAVMEYNAEHANLAFAYAEDIEDTDDILPVAIEELTLEAGTATMRLQYATAADYLNFNENQLGEDAAFTVCAVADAAAGSDAGWIKCSDNSAVESATALTAKKNYYFVELSFAATVQVEGKLVYLSDNAAMVDENTFTADGEEPAYAVFKK